MRGDIPVMDRYSFRLDVDTSSSYSDSSTTDKSSIYKQRIDSMFKQRKSIYQAEPTMSNSDYETVDRIGDERSQHFLNARSAVQAQMEIILAKGQGTKQASRPLPMLPDPTGKFYIAHKKGKQYASEESRAKTSMNVERSASSVKTVSSCFSENKVNDVSKNANSAKFRIDYLGALAIEDKATQLEDLQQPLKKLYMEYQLMLRQRKSTIPGSLAITETGVKVNYIRELHKGVQEIFNPFATIAVWAAVKFVVKKVAGKKGQVELKYAFLPLICDPEGQEKFTLYNDLESELINEAVGVNHPPVFACVMRKPGLIKTLECHGFVCSTSEDAIVMAANLYQALLSSMQSDNSSISSPVQNTSKSSASSSDISRVNSSEPLRPPRRRKAPPPPNGQNPYRSASSSQISEQRKRIQKRPPSVRRSQSRLGSYSDVRYDLRRPRSVSRAGTIRGSRRLTRSASDRRRDSKAAEATQKLGNKNSLPRSSSVFDINHRVNMREFLVQIQKRDGIRTVNDVLRRVVNPEGMSFSELKPEHRELLLRLALTLSQDEMYQRSKYIMKKQTKKGLTLEDSDTDISTISNVLKATRKSFSRFGYKSRTETPNNVSNSNKKSPLKRLYIKKSDVSKANSHIPIGSNFVRQENQINRRNSDHVQTRQHNRWSKSDPRALIPYPMKKEQDFNECCDCSCDSESVYSAKCYCSLTKNGGDTKSKSALDLPCECDTESCAESEKCYCSLKRVTTNGMKMYEIKLDTESETTDSTIRSSRIVQSNKNRHHCASMSNLSRVDSPLTAWHKNSSNGEMVGRKSMSSLLSTSSGVMKDNSLSAYYGEQRDMVRKRVHSSNISLNSDQIQNTSRSNPSKSYSIDNLHQSANGFIFNRLTSNSSLSAKSNQSTRSTNKFMLVSAAAPNGKIVYRSGSQRLRLSHEQMDPMSLKKTTEIAATFSGLKLNQTTDLLNESEDDAYGSMQNASSHNTPSRHVYSGQNIENSLGYLP